MSYDLRTRARAAIFQGGSAESGSLTIGYNFDRDGGAVGDIILGNAQVPVDAVITLVAHRTLLDFAGGDGSTVGIVLVDPLGIADNTDLLASAAISELTTGDAVVIRPDVTISEARNVVLQIGTDPLTAGRLIMEICYCILGI